MKLKYLDIAGFRFGIREDGHLKAVLSPPYFPFMCPCQEAGDHEEEIIQINLHPGSPPGIESFRELFADYTDDQNTGILPDYKWSILGNDRYNAILISEPQSNKPESITLFEYSCGEFNIYLPGLPDKTAILEYDPFKYPLGPLILYQVSLKNKAAMIHASGICTKKGTGMMFAALSGTGKSTMAGIWEKEGARVINDDRLLLRFQNGNLFMHNTPMLYPDMPKHCILHKIFLLRQSHENYLSRLDGATAVSRLLSHFIQHHHSEENVNNHLTLASEICRNAEIFECGFRPDKDIVRFILEQTLSL